jgi:hypothetical protein
MDTNVLDSFVLDGIQKIASSNTWSGHDRGTTIGASEIGQCARRIFYDKHGVEPDPEFEQDMGAAERGHAIEDWYVERVRAGLPDGVKLLKAGTDQHTLARGAQSATPDGILLDERGATPLPTYLEIKSVDPRLYDVMTTFKSPHMFQSIQGMDLVRALLKYDVRHAILAYINTSFVTQRRYYRIDFDEKIAASLRKRAEDLLFGTYTVKNPPRAEGKMEGGKECDYCPYYRTCTAFDVGCLPTEVRPLQDIPAEALKELHELVVQQRATRQRLNELEQTKGVIEADIAEMLKTLDTRTVKTSWGSVTTFGANAPPSYDFKQMEADGIDLDKYRKPGARGTRLNITFKG